MVSGEVSFIRSTKDLGNHSMLDFQKDVELDMVIEHNKGNNGTLYSKHTMNAGHTSNMIIEEMTDDRQYTMMRHMDTTEGSQRRTQRFTVKTDLDDVD